MGFNQMTVTSPVLRDKDADSPAILQVAKEKAPSNILSLSLSPALRSCVVASS